MEITLAFFQYTLVLSLILTTIYTSFFYREVYAAGSVISKFIGIFFYSSVLFLFLNKVLDWSTEKIYSMTVKFFLALSFVGILGVIIKVLLNKDYSGMNMLSFMILLALLVACLSAVFSAY